MGTDKMTASENVPIDIGAVEVMLKFYTSQTLAMDTKDKLRISLESILEQFVTAALTIDGGHEVLVRIAEQQDYPESYRLAAEGNFAQAFANELERKAEQTKRVIKEGNDLPEGNAEFIGNVGISAEIIGYYSLYYLTRFSPDYYKAKEIPTYAQKNSLAVGLRALELFTDLVDYAYLIRRYDTVLLNDLGALYILEDERNKRIFGIGVPDGLRSAMAAQLPELTDKIFELARLDFEMTWGREIKIGGVLVDMKVLSRYRETDGKDPTFDRFLAAENRSPFRTIIGLEMLKLLEHGLQTYANIGFFASSIEDVAAGSYPQEVQKEAKRMLKKAREEGFLETPGKLKRLKTWVRTKWERKGGRKL